MPFFTIRILNCFAIVLATLNVLCCSSDESVEIDSKYKVTRRTIEDAIVELTPLLDSFNELSHAEHLQIQDISYDLVAQMPDSSPEQRYTVVQTIQSFSSNIYSKSSNRRSEPFSKSNWTSLSQDQQRSRHQVLQPLKFALPPKKAIRISAYSYCLDSDLDSPSEHDGFVRSQLERESPIKLLVVHHARTTIHEIDYQNILWVVEQGDETWQNVPEDLKNIFADLQIQIPDQDLTLTEVSQLPIVNDFIQGHHLVDEYMKNIDLEWRADGFTQGVLSVYNNSDSIIELNGSQMMTRFEPRHRVESENLAIIHSSPDATNVSSTDHEESCPEEPQPQVQDILIDEIHGEQLSELSSESLSMVERVANIMQIREGDSIPAMLTKRDDNLEKIMRLGAELFAAGASLAAEDLISHSELSLDGLEPSRDAILNKVLTIDLDKTDIRMEDWLTIAEFIATYKTTARRFVDSLARTKRVSPEMYNLILGFETMNASGAQIQQLKQLLSAKLIQAYPSGSGKLMNVRSPNDFVVQLRYDSNRATVTFNGRDLSYFLPEIYTVLNHPSLIPDIASMWDIHTVAYEKAQMEAGCVDEPSLEDGYFDAYRHALWSGIMAAEHGACKSEWMGSGHEENISGGNHPLKKEMDLYNNALGRTVESDLQQQLGRKPTVDELSSEIKNRLDDGQGLVIQTVPTEHLIESSKYTSICN